MNLSLRQLFQKVLLQQAGMQDGDLVTKINGVSITTWEELSEEVKVSSNEAMEFTVERDGESLDLKL